MLYTYPSYFCHTLPIFNRSCPCPVRSRQPLLFRFLRVSLSDDETVNSYTSSYHLTQSVKFTRSPSTSSTGPSFVKSKNCSLNRILFFNTTPESSFLFLNQQSSSITYSSLSTFNQGPVLYYPKVLLRGETRE